MDARAQRVTDVRAPRRGSQRRAVYLDGELWCEANISVLRALGIEVGAVIDARAVEEQAREIEERLARERALRLLGYRDHSARALVDRLADDGYPRSVAEAVVSELGQQGLVDDRRYADSVAHALTTGRGLGRARARRELARLGVPDDIAETALDGCSASADEPSRALELAVRMRRPSDTPERLARRLISRGFTIEDSIRAAQAALRDLGLDPEPVEVDPHDEGT